MLLHPLVVHFPLAPWLTSLFFDLLAWRQGDPVYRRAAYWLVGLVKGDPASPPPSGLLAGERRSTERNATSHRRAKSR